MVPKTFRPWQPGQTSLLRPSPSDWLSDVHQVGFLLDLVDELDPLRIHGRGAPRVRGAHGSRRASVSLELDDGGCTSVSLPRRSWSCCKGS